MTDFNRDAQPDYLLYNVNTRQTAIVFTPIVELIVFD